MNIWDEIYEKKVWGEGSGPGSAEETTREYREFLEVFISGVGAKSVLDFGCGDGLLASLTRWKTAGVHSYFGYDPSSIASRQAAERMHGRTDKVGIFDSSGKATLPFTDLVIIKDVFQHLSWSTIGLTMMRLRFHKHLLITNDISRDEDDHDIKDGEWRPIDIRSLGYTCAVVKEFDSVPLRKRVLMVVNK